MSDEEQYWSAITISNSRGEIKGCGFLIDAAHVMTCAHVVEFCRDSEPAALSADQFFVIGHKDGCSFRLRPVDNALDLADEDIAVLALEEGERFHEDAAIVEWEPCRSQLEYRGTGIMQVTDEDGTVRIQSLEIDGVVGGLARPTRYSVNATEDDLKIEAGCSGGAVFSKSGDRGLIGMVSEYQQDRSGTIIHSRALSDSWPQLRRCKSGPAEPFADLAPPAAAGALVLPDLEDTISCCDREPQTDPFRDRMRVLEKTRQGALLTTIRGQAVDLPDLLSDRLCALGPLALVRRKANAESKPLPRPSIDMVKCAAPTAAAMRAKVEYRLQDMLKSERPEAAAFIKAIRKLGRPFTLEVRVTEAFIAANGAAAVEVWTRLAKEIGTRQLGSPLFVFFLVVHDGEEGGAIPGWASEDEAFLVLDPLEPVSRDDIETWSNNTYGEELSEAIMGIVAQRAGAAGPVRLKQLQDWLSGN